MLNYRAMMVLLSLLATAISYQTTARSSLMMKSMDWSRFPKAIGASALLLTSSQPAFAELTPAPWDSAVKYEVVKASGSEVVPVPGDLVTIRFRGTYKDVAFDDTFATNEPYFYRCGVGSIVKGLDDAVVHMHAGDRIKLRFGGDLAFPNGKPSAPGKPRIPPKADVDYEVELVDVPGKGEEYILDD